MLQANESLSRSLAFNGFQILTTGVHTGNFAGFQVIQDAVVKAESRKDVTERYTSDDLADNGDYTTGGELTFLAGYIDLGAYKEIEVVSGVIKAFRG